MIDRPTTLERAGLATLGGDRDALMAMGVAAVRGNADALPLLRLHLAATLADFTAARHYVWCVVEKISAREHWKLHHKHLSGVVAMALAFHICPVCTHCHGRKRMLAPDGETLSTKPCKHCRGEGRRPVRGVFKYEVERTLVALEMLDNQTEKSIRKLLQ